MLLVAGSMGPDPVHSAERVATDVEDPGTDSQQGLAPTARRLPASQAGDPVVLELSLDEAIRTGLRHGLDIRIESLERQIRRRRLVIEKAVFDPYFNLDFTYTRHRDPTVSPIELSSATALTGVTLNPFETTHIQGGLRTLTKLGSTVELALALDGYDNPAATLNALNPHWRSAVEFSITQPLLKNAWYGVNTAAIEIARNSLRIATDGHELSLVTTIEKVASAYWDLVFAHRNHGARLRALEVVREQLEMQREKLRVGQLAEIDLVTTESQLALRSRELDEARALIERSRDELLVEMNFMGERSLRDYWSSPDSENPFRNLAIVPTSKPGVDRGELDREESIQAAFRNRVEVRQALTEIQNQRLAVKVAHNQILPDLDLFASWKQSGLAEPVDESVEDIGDGEYYTWAVGLQLEIPLTLRGPLNAYRNARSVLERLEIRRQQLENAIVVEVDQALRDLELGFRSREHLERQVEAHRRLLEAEREKLRQGQATAYTISLIENDLVEAETLALRAETDLEKARVRYEKAVGILLVQRAAVPQPTRDP